MSFNPSSALEWQTVRHFAEHYARTQGDKITDAARDGAIDVMTSYGFTATVDVPDEAARAAIQTILEIGFMAGFGACVSHFKSKLASEDARIEGATGIELEVR